MKKKIFIGLLIGLLLFSGLSGCTQVGPEPTPTPTPSPSEEANPEQIPTPTITEGGTEEAPPELPI